MVPGNACRPAPLYMAMISSWKKVLKRNSSRQNLCARILSQHHHTVQQSMKSWSTRHPTSFKCTTTVNCCNYDDTGVLSSKFVLGVTSHRDIACSLSPQQACKSQPLSPPGFSQQLLEGSQNPLAANVRSEHARRIVHHTAHSAKAIHLPCIHQHQ